MNSVFLFLFVLDAALVGYAVSRKSYGTAAFVFTLSLLNTVHWVGRSA